MECSIQQEYYARAGDGKANIGASPVSPSIIIIIIFIIIIMIL